MNDKTDKDFASGAGRTTVERTSDREMTVTRLFDAPARIIFQAWTEAALFARWWVPKSIGIPLRSCEMDVRTGGTYRLVFGEDESNTWTFFGRYLEVIPPTRIVWTNEEDANGAISTVILREDNGKTLLTFTETYPSKEALEASLGGMEGAPEQFEQLDALLLEMIAKDI